ncbi:YpiF family protein [Bacillus seohaeanensis]|jgi:Protein of unknown function (DUF2487)|uniref:YpiF family protein n=1 Tax=Bacillus seohaeanensis TaxID=284580 RepID=A0ABW5RLF1_9BACI
MNWIGKDIDVLLREKEFIDTAVIPLIPVDFLDEIKTSAAQNEFISLLQLHLERQFKGRMIITPPFTYLLSQTKEDLKANLSMWTEAVTQSGIKHAFLLTSDSGWKKVEEDLGDNLIWVPSIPLEHMEEQYKHSIMEDQVKQLLNVIVQKWQKNS